MSVNPTDPIKDTIVSELQYSEVKIHMMPKVYAE